ncbi:MAG TPA: serine/threonine-protein kinase [Polyangia bacterium]|nr:serine/threonine-protein kinase [Polyangia bacterium]
MTGRRNIVIVLALAAVGAAGLAARGLVVSARRSADAAPAKLEARAAADRARLESTLAALTRPLEADVAQGAAVPGLKAALTDRVDGPTMLDLFETEDWWAPFRTRDTAVLVNGQVVTARGEKNPPAPRGLSAAASQPGVTSGILVGARPVLAAAAPIALPGRADATTLLLTAPVDMAALAASVGHPVALSDGHRLLSATGDANQRAIFARLPGKEATATVSEASGLLAVALPAGPGVWLWTISSMPAPPAEASADPRLWSALTGLLILAAVLAWTTRPRSSPERVTPVAATPHLHQTVETAMSDPKLPGTMILGPSISDASHDPSMFGRYRLLRRLDGGGMADIYTAVLEGAEGFQRTFVIKRLRPELTRSRGAVEQFIDEAKLGSTLTHPNIVPVFDFGKVGDEYFMAEEYIVGRDLMRVVQRHVERTGRPLGEKLMIYVAHEVLEALAYAHAHLGPDGKPLSIVHRDISPGNIMLTTRGDVKLYDFGIVKAAQRVSRTEAGVVKGNVSFMSPEQARGQPVDARSDLFSLGLVIYYTLTAEQIYRASGTFEQLLQAASGPTAEDLSKIAAHPVASRVLRRALAVDPTQRYQTAAEFAADISHHLAGGKTEAATTVQQLFGEELRAAAAG